MSAIASALGVSRTSIYRQPAESLGRRASGDEELLERIRLILEAKPSLGYRRVTAVLRREGRRVNHNRIYGLMKAAGLLLERFAPNPNRPHDGKVITLKSDLRWCSDAFMIRCLSGEGGTSRFPSTAATGRASPLSLLTRTSTAKTSVTSLRHLLSSVSATESNGMAEAFVKTFKRDFVYLADVRDAKTVLAQLPKWFEEYNETHPHKGLKMLSPREFRRARSAQQFLFSLTGATTRAAPSTGKWVYPREPRVMRTWMPQG